METQEERIFREYLSCKELKFTPERHSILEQVFRMHDHFEADDVSAGLKSRGRRVSRASVYRTLPLLVDSGLLREVDSPEKHTHYEHTLGHEHHDHLICTRCGETIEFSNREIEEMQTRICELHGFHPTAHKLEITGTCKKCKAGEQ